MMKAKEKKVLVLAFAPRPIFIVSGPSSLIAQNINCSINAMERSIVNEKLQFNKLRSV